MNYDRFSSVLARVVGGAIIGGAFALSIKLIELLRLVTSEIVDSPPPSEWRVSLLMMIGIVLSGAVGGWLLPFARKKAAAAAVGLLVLQPFVAGMILSLPKFRLTDPDTWIFWCMVSLLFGPLVGLVLVRDYLLNVIGVHSTS
jgi:hypothetical protein